jgi:site-specific DNA recombinase
LGTVASEWNARGLTTTAGGPWTTTPLRRTLLNPRYSGRAVYLGEDYGRGAWPAILTPATQAQLEEYLRDPRRRMQASTNVKYLLSGLCLCGRCGAVMFASPMGERAKRWMVYRCRTSHLMRRLDLVDEVVEGVMVARLSRPDVLQLLTPDEDVDELRREIVELRDRREALAGMLAEGLLPAASVRESSRKLTDAISVLEGRLRTALGENPAAAVAGAADVAAAWESADLMTKRTIISTLADVTILPAGKGVRFDPESVVVTWRGPE